MATIERIRCQWSGFTGSPGLSTFYCTDAITLLPQVRTFFQAFTAFLPPAVVISFEPFGARIESTTGVLTGAWSTGVTPATVQGSSAASYSAPAGMMVNWLTTAVVNGRFLRGKTFLVPAAAAALDGTPATAAVSALQAAAVALNGAGGNLLVWHRPTTEAPTSGAAFAVSSVQVPDKIVVLRSRRD